MDCMRAQTLLSASLDGEAQPADAAPLQAHLATCGTCATFASDATSLHRLVRIAPAEPVPDLTAEILRATPLPDAPAAGAPLRLALVAIAIVQVMVSLPSLFVASEHSQHLSAFDLALAVGFLWVAARGPRTLSGFLPIGTALVLLCVGLTFSDALNGSAESVRVVTHSVAVLGIIAAWLLEVQLHRAQPHRNGPRVPATS
jgi:predicted anti-sigma-YlaC factor YlaD